jgi:hypothetical protein
MQYSSRAGKHWKIKTSTMFRKTLSKNRIKLSQALRQEFEVYLRRMEGYAVKMLCKYPKLLLSAMLICMLSSITITFFFRGNLQKPVSIKPVPGSAIIKSTGIDQLFTAGMALREVINLRGQVNALLYKDSLNKRDSVLLRETTRRLEYIQHQIKPKP